MWNLHILSQANTISKKNHDVYISEYHYSNCFVNPIQTGGELAKKMSNRLSYMYDHQILVISP